MLGECSNSVKTSDKKSSNVSTTVTTTNSKSKTTTSSISTLSSIKPKQCGKIWMEVPILEYKPKIDTNELYEKIQFSESLLISLINPPIPLGGITIDIQKGATDKLLVHVSSQFDYNDKIGGSRITSWINKAFQCLEERRVEYVKGVEEKKIYIYLKEKYLHVKVPDETKLYDKTLPIITEGGNFPFMRFLAIIKFVGIVEFCTLYIDGSLCRNIYEAFDIYSETINNLQIDLIKIKRTIIEQCGIEHVSYTILTLQGQLIEHKWDDCNYYFHINPLAIINNNEKPKGIIHIPLNKCWEEDIEMCSIYMDEKQRKELIMKTYLKEHPEITDLCSDYLSVILQLKPDDILQFTCDYFCNYQDD